MTRTKRRRRTLIAVLLALVVAAATYGFTATNTVPGSYAGDGNNTISGYTVTNVDYTLNATDPSLIDKVDFTLNSAAGEVKVKLVSTGTTYSNCTVTGGTSVSCDFPTGSEPTVLAADQLRVIAVQ
ncbi:MAG: hypothetical protein OEV72_01465 [Thermoleophilia bacterium]|nr:hypothetical protein [Thermoleophilia bacterium]MDH5332461.1 hypothetical protein [Thermoleophilia bacterium]